MYNEEAVLALFAARLRPVLAALDVRYEVVAVDDGSTDATAAALMGLRRSWPELRVVRLRRNCGHQAALTAGLHHARGDWVVSIDADLQDPPEKIREMLDLARADSLDVVYGVRIDRGTDSFLKRTTAAIYYGLMRRLVGKNVPAHAGDFRLLSRAAVDALGSLPEQQPVYRLLVPWLGFPSGEVTYVRESRAAGTTKYPLGKMIRLAWDSVTNFSAAPLQVATKIGAATMVFCMLAVMFSIGSYALGKTVSGWTSLTIAVLFLGAVQLICLGLAGEYLGRIYSAVQGRPAYFVAQDTRSDALGVAADEVPADIADIADLADPAGRSMAAAGGGTSPPRQPPRQA
jgi:polyisoprenyl-phosphate glycosyltransferase